MADKYRLHGIETVSLGDVGADGAMGGTLVAVGALVKESVIFEIEEPEIARIMVEGTDDPDILAITQGGMKTLKFQTRDFDINNLVSFFGGAVSETIYSAPVNSNTKIWQSVEVIGNFVNGMQAKLSIPKALIYAKMTGGFTPGDSGIMEVTCEVGVPVNATGVALSPYTFTYVDEA